LASSWTTYPHLKSKLVAGFLVGFVVLGLLAFFVLGRNNSKQQPGPGVTTRGVLLGWTVAFPAIALLVIRPGIERYQREDPEPRDSEG
jgi:hypothetical protein